MRVSWLVTALLLLLPSQSRQADPTPGESLQFAVEWRLIHAGDARLSAGGSQARLQLQSVGLVSMLYRVDDLYSVQMGDNFCAAASTLTANEGLRSRETRITYDSQRRKASYQERDLKRNVNLASSEVDIPPCVHEIVGGLYQLRALRLPPGKTAEIAITDGKKTAMARVEAQQQETVQTPAGKFKTIRYEAYLFNNVLYRRSGRLHIWLTDDDRRLPVQIRARLSFPIGAITLQLVKVEGV